MKNRKIDQKRTMQVVIDKGYHTLLKRTATDAGMTIKDFLEGHLAELFSIGSANTTEKILGRKV